MSDLEPEPRDQGVSPDQGVSSDQGVSPGQGNGVHHRWLQRLSAGRPRTSTIVLTVLFLGVFALWISVRPDTTSSGSAGYGTSGNQGQGQSHYTAPASPEPTATPTHTPTHRPTTAPASPTATPNPTGSPRPDQSPTPSPSVTIPVPTTGSPTTGSTTGGTAPGAAQSAGTGPTGQ